MTSPGCNHSDSSLFLAPLIGLIVLGRRALSNETLSTAVSTCPGSSTLARFAVPCVFIASSRLSNTPWCSPAVATSSSTT
eukprot:CAMPEP_0198684462 /NCGR_PEP_ID=MMETSP1468-20131203/12247_1 /TAXON_ID=1461545 /ORGANISM="Mantoniella sp, Strain CCMP1436" /LENGTH=79 /DNA_ID=CAMNT_0044429297 /DNA_START=443 /DNA_END=678 /DNA_ORIENTATION=-